MNKVKKVVAVTRSFQAGKSIETFDEKAFEKHAGAIEELLQIREIDSLIVVTCGDGKFSEVASGGILPTVAKLSKSFSYQISQRKIVPHVCKSWGTNRGSANALTEGAQLADLLGADYILNWSPEIDCDVHLIHDMLSHSARHSLAVVGAYRQNWWERPQWAVPQNTIALWKTDILLGVNGFAPECNGTGRTVATKEYGDAPLAGMEDYHALLRILRDQPQAFRWGMIRQNAPLTWDTAFAPGSDREKDHLIKVARQGAVMEAYANDIFPDIRFGELMDYHFFANGYAI